MKEFCPISQKYVSGTRERGKSSPAASLAVRTQNGCYVFQDSDNQMFMPTVYEDMIFGPLNYGKSRKEADQLAREALEELDLIHLKDRQNYKMSGGEKRIAAIATILAMNPKVMLMDEPSTALDPKNRRRLIRILAEKSSVKCFVEISLLFVKENVFSSSPGYFLLNRRY